MGKLIRVMAVLTVAVCLSIGTMGCKQKTEAPAEVVEGAAEAPEAPEVDTEEVKEVEEDSAE